MLATKENIQELMRTDNYVRIAYVYSFRSPKYYKLCDDLTVQLSNGEIHTISAGMCTDLCSVPRFLWSIFSPCNDSLFAFLLHDYLYIHQPPGWDQKKADQEMLFWSKIVNTGSRKQNIDNYLRYYAVRLFGHLVWRRII